MLLFSREDKIFYILVTTILIFYRELYRNIVSIIVLNIEASQYNIKINLAISCSLKTIILEEIYLLMHSFEVLNNSIYTIKYRLNHNANDPSTIMYTAVTTLASSIVLTSVTHITSSRSTHFSHK